MNNVSPFVMLFGGCCVWPLLLFVLGVWLGKNGMPFEIRRKRRHPVRSRFAE